MAKRGEPDYAPVLIVGAATIAAGALYLILRPKAAAASSPPTQPGPSIAPPPAVSPTASQTPLASSQAIVDSRFPPLYLWIVGDGEDVWTGYGWFSGHQASIQTSGYAGPRTVWITPMGEILVVLNDLVNQGIAGYWDTIEPTGEEDKDYRGRLDQNDKGVWFWIEATPDEPGHYETEIQHQVADYVG